MFAEEASIQDVVAHQKQEAERALEDLPAEAILARPLEELIPEVVDRFRLDVPVLQRATTPPKVTLALMCLARLVVPSLTSLRLARVDHLNH